MKIRYWIAGYTGMLLLVLFYIYQSFSSVQSAGRDMVHYNEQYILITDDIGKGIERNTIEKKYNCEIIFRSDDGYEIDLQTALQKEAVLMDYCKQDVLLGKIIWNEEEWHYESMKQQLQKKTLLLWGLMFLGGYFVLFFLYWKMIRPFWKLQKFTMQVAKGNLDFPLPAGKSDYFGAYTESFDLMREELKRARESEYLANQSKKELMAELSHDIKTPIATIQATCEVMQLKEKNPDTANKIVLIDSKARMIHNLVDNLFHATLEELTVLKVEAVEESSLRIQEMFSSMEFYGELKVMGDVPQCLVYMDCLRLQQVIDNCLNNAWKYANTPVEVSFGELENGISIQIKDYGRGVAEEELPLILEKFYRGSNAKGKEGSGLGLYLAKTFMEQMKGDLEYYNEDGFVVVLFLRKV